MTKNAYLVMWCSEGLESIVPITEYEQAERHSLFDTIKTGTKAKNKLNEIINYMILRARFNQHRFYEIYAVDCDAGITKETLEHAFDDNPNAAAQLIRARGVHIWGESMQTSKVKIT
jgi:hypothetical protein